MSEYIKKEAIIAKARKLQFGRILTENEVEAVMMVLESIHKMDVIDNPTTGVRHGRLLNPNPYGECSLCGYLIDIRDSHNYCPNCGAKMDGDADDE